MPTQITNQATLTYNYGSSTGSAASNIATVTLQDALSVQKSTLGNTYRANDEITYVLAMSNTGTTPLTDLSITDDLGTYTLPGSVSATPLTYVGPALLYINGTYNTTVTPTINANNIVFPIGSLPAGANAILLYRADTNGNAQLFPDSTITNTATFNATGLPAPITASATVTVENYASVQILKSMSPNPVSGGGTLTYTFTLYNYGNTEATGVVLSDTFNPAPTNIAVTLNGVTVPSASYTYTSGTLTLPVTGAATTITVPAATITQNDTTGAVTVSPGTTVITVTGTI